MRLAIPVEEKSPEAKVCASFGRTPYFLVYDSLTKESVFLDNGAASSTGGAGIQAAQTIADSKAEALLTPRCGENAANVLKAAGVRLYKTADGSAMQNLDAFAAGKLLPLDEIHAGLHGHGGN